MITFDHLGDHMGYEKLNPTSSTGCTAAKILPTSGNFNGILARAIIVRPETNNVRYRMDGTAPTATTGTLLKADDILTLTGTNNIKNFRCIDTAAGASDVHVDYYTM